MANPWTPEEELVLKDLAGKVPAEQIGLVLGRTTYAVRARIARMGLNGRLSGEYHWQSKLPNLVAGMVGVLGEAGYTPKEIEVVMSTPYDITRQVVEAICSKRTRAKSAVRPAAVRPTPSEGGSLRRVG